MTNLEQEALVLHLAILTEDRTDAEQKAMLAMAERLDRAFNKNVVTNKAMWGERAGSIDAVQQRPLSNLVRDVRESRSL